jgi:hypothetical protein
MATTDTHLRPEPTWASKHGHIALAGPVPGANGGRELDRLLAIETIHRFAFAFGERNLEVLRDTFTADATFAADIGGGQPVGPYEGRDTVVSWLTSYWDRQTDQRRHLVTNPAVDGLTDASVTVTAILTLVASANGAMRAITAGFYRCELRKEDDGAWRIARFGAGYDTQY